MRNPRAAFAGILPPRLWRGLAVSCITRSGRSRLYRRGHNGPTSAAANLRDPTRRYYSTARDKGFAGAGTFARCLRWRLREMVLWRHMTDRIARIEHARRMQREWARPDESSR